MRKFTTAEARCGSKLGLTPPCTMVAAVEVRIRALVVGAALNLRSITFPSRPALRRANAIGAGSTGATAAKNACCTSSRAGIGWRSRAWIAVAMRPIAVDRGGIDECPPASSAIISTFRYPFSPIPSSATGSSTPGSRSRTTAPPSSST